MHNTKFNIHITYVSCNMYKIKLFLQIELLFLNFWLIKEDNYTPLAVLGIGKIDTSWSQPWLDLV